MSEDPEDDVPIEGDIDEGKEEDSTQSLEGRY